MTRSLTSFLAIFFALASLGLAQTPRQLLDEAAAPLLEADGVYEGWFQPAGGASEKFVVTFNNGRAVYAFSQPDERIEFSTGSAKGIAKGELESEIRGSCLTREDLSLSMLGWKITRMDTISQPLGKFLVFTVKNDTGIGSYTHAKISVREKMMAVDKIETFAGDHLAKELAIQSFRDFDGETLPTRVRTRSWARGGEKKTVTFGIEGRRS